MEAIISGKPYTDQGDIRSFDLNKPQEDYVWHRDMTDREIEVIEGQGWQLQFDGCLPFLLEEKSVYFIPKLEYHRLIKGATPLVLKVINRDINA